MWHANVSRRQVLEILLAGSLPRVVEVNGLSGSVSGGENGFDVFWSSRPDGSVGDLPVLMVVNDDDMHEVMAMLGAAPQIPSPFTAFCRIVPRSHAAFLDKSSERVRPEIIHGLAGLSLSEAAVYSGSAVRISETSPAACGRTFSFVYGRALAQLPFDALSLVTRRWLETQNVLGLSTVEFGRVTRGMMPILGSATNAFLGIAPHDSISKIISGIIEDGEPSETAWQVLNSRREHVPSLKFLSQANREERSAAFQDLLRDSYSVPLTSVSDETVASCALAGTRIAPGSFEHLGLLAGHADVRLPLWYGFFAGLQRGGSALRANSALGLRIVRDMDRGSGFRGAPTADISSDELMIVFRKNLEQLGRKLNHANEIVVELFPGLDASFRYVSRAERRGPTLQADLAVRPRELTLTEKIDSARKLLAEVSRELIDVDVRSRVAKTSKKRSPKPGQLI